VSAEVSEQVTDAELVARYRRDPDLFTAVHDRYYRDIYLYVAGRLDTQIAEDLVAETFLLAFDRRDRYDPERGSFTAYAAITIVGEIKRHFRDRTWDIRVPRRLQELKLDINEATATLAQRLGRSPTVGDIAEYLHRSEDEVLEGLDSARAYSAVSLQTLVGVNEDSTELGDLLGADDSEMELAEFRASLGPALETLSAREQRIVLLRFFGNLTQTQIAERVGISQMHVSRLLARSLVKLRGQLTMDG